MNLLRENIGKTLEKGLRDYVPSDIFLNFQRKFKDFMTTVSLMPQEKCQIFSGFTLTIVLSVGSIGDRFK